MILSFFFLVWLPLSTILLTSYLPLAICIDRPLRSAIEDVAWANIAACLVVVRGMRVPAEKIIFQTRSAHIQNPTIIYSFNGTLSRFYDHGDKIYTVWT